ncbi:hypothetical protein [Nitrospira sp. Ecomares 2.1]
MDFPADGFATLIFPIFLVGNPDIIFDSCGSLAVNGREFLSDGEDLDILPNFFIPFPEPFPEDPVGVGKGNEGNFFFFRASPEKTRT